MQFDPTVNQKRVEDLFHAILYSPNAFKSVTEEGCRFPFSHALPQDFERELARFLQKINSINQKDDPLDVYRFIRDGSKPTAPAASIYSSRSPNNSVKIRRQKAIPAV